MSNSNLPAFPLPIKHDKHEVFDGLTKREYFALHLMQGLISGADRHSQKGDCQSWNYEHLAKISIVATDALFDALNQTP